MKKTVLFLVLIYTMFVQAAKLYAVSGRIIRFPFSVSMEYVMISLAGTSFFTFSDANGFFKIENVPEGQYQLIAEYLGFNTVRIDINAGNAEQEFSVRIIRQGQSEQMNYTTVLLKESPGMTQIEKSVVYFIGRYAQTYFRPGFRPTRPGTENNLP